MKKHLVLASFLAVSLTVFAATGCSKKPAETNATAPVAGEAAKETSAAAPAGGGAYTMEALCNKVLTETKATAGGMMPEAAMKMGRDACMKSGEAHKSMPHYDEVMSGYVKAILTACEGKTGKDWMACYSVEVPKAQEGMMKMMQEKSK